MANELEYLSVHEGEKIDEAISVILNGEIDEAAAHAKAAADAAKKSASAAGASALEAGSAAQTAAASQLSATQSADAANTAKLAAAAAQTGAQAAKDQAVAAASSAANETAENLRAQMQGYTDDAQASRDAANTSAISAIQSEASATVARNDAQGYAQTALEEAERAERVAVSTPYLSDTGTWMVYDAISGRYVDSGAVAIGIKGDKGETGAQGERGETGAQGVAGAVVAVGGFYGFEVNSEGMLTLVCADDADQPDFTLEEDGHLYLTVE